MDILNRRNESTCSGSRSDVIHITQESLRLLENIIGREVSSDNYLSDHRHSVHLTGLGTGASNQESPGHQLGLLQRGRKGAGGEGPCDGNEK